MLRNLINFTFINLTPEREGPEKHTSFVAQTSQDFNPPPQFSLTSFVQTINTPLRQRTNRYFKAFENYTKYILLRPLTYKHTHTYKTKKGGYNYFTTLLLRHLTATTTKKKKKKNI